MPGAACFWAGVSSAFSCGLLALFLEVNFDLSMADMELVVEELRIEAVSGCFSEEDLKSETEELVEDIVDVLVLVVVG